MVSIPMLQKGLRLGWENRPSWHRDLGMLNKQLLRHFSTGYRNKTNTP